MSAYSSMPLVCIHIVCLFVFFFFLILLVYTGFNFIVTHAHHLGLQSRALPPDVNIWTLNTIKFVILLWSLPTPHTIPTVTIAPKLPYSLSYYEPQRLSFQTLESGSRYKSHRVLNYISFIYA